MAFILPAKKSDRQPSHPWGSSRLTNQHRASDQESQMEYIPPRRMSCVLRSISNCFVCIVIMKKINNVQNSAYLCFFFISV